MRQGELAHLVGDILSQKPHLKAEEKPYDASAVTIQRMINQDKMERRDIPTDRSIQRGRRNAK